MSLTSCGHDHSGEQQRVDEYGEALPITGCEKHIMLEQKAIAATEDDKTRFEDKYITPLVNQRVFEVVAKPSGPRGHACSHHHAPGVPCTNCGKTNDTDDSDDELDEAEILAKMREHRLERMEYQREQAKMVAKEQTGMCRHVEFAKLPGELICRDATVVCAMVDQSEASHAIIQAMNHVAPQHPGIKFIYCEMPPDKLGLSEEFGWQLTYLTKLPDLLCYDRGVYVKHHGKIASHGSNMRSLFQDLKDWVTDMLTKVKPTVKKADLPCCNDEATEEAAAAADKAQRERERRTPRSNGGEGGWEAAGMSLAAMMMRPGLDVDSDDSEPEVAPFRRTRNPLSAKKQIHVSKVIERTLYRRVSSGSDSDD